MLTARMEVIDLATGQTYATANTRKDGTALVCLPAGRNYALNVNRKDYLFHSENFNLSAGNTIDKPYKLNVALQPITPGEAGGGKKTVVLNNVFFASGSAELLPESGTELKRLAELLTANPAVNIQINGHTDNVGDDAANLKLSENRARAVYDFLVAQGVDAARLRSKGFGESKPLAGNDTAEGRAKNRRTEFELW
jgi:outer membrane protein OmpA-like peptidoglycan-associated protein